MNRFLVSAASIAAFGLLAACGPSPDDHAQDVAKAQ